ncbi:MULTISPECIES: hypothetical protein [Paenibacillus]|uniref:hypothetical protein n=1 Tax=Paenibacillus TaxID=44249 RepID=UPI0011A8715F|nr:hypothetical protein [Paenibacillus sp. IHBB 10380]
MPKNARIAECLAALYYGCCQSENSAPLAALDAAVTASSLRRKPILYALLFAYGEIRERGD